jgi:hypothetical protein
MTRSASLKISHDQQCYGLVGLTGNAAASDADDNQKLADLGVSLASVLVRDCDAVTTRQARSTIMSSMLCSF